MKGSDKNKAILLVLLLVLVALVAAWNFGLFGGGKGAVVAPAPANNSADANNNAGSDNPPTEGGPANRRQAPK